MKRAEVLIFLLHFGALVRCAGASGQDAPVSCSEPSDESWFGDRQATFVDNFPREEDTTLRSGGISLKGRLLRENYLRKGSRFTELSSNSLRFGEGKQKHAAEAKSIFFKSSVSGILNCGISHTFFAETGAKHGGAFVKSIERFPIQQSEENMCLFRTFYKFITLPSHDNQSRRDFISLSGLLTSTSKVMGICLAHKYGRDAIRLLEPVLTVNDYQLLADNFPEVVSASQYLLGKLNDFSRFNVLHISAAIHARIDWFILPNALKTLTCEALAAIIDGQHHCMLSHSQIEAVLEARPLIYNFTASSNRAFLLVPAAAFALVKGCDFPIAELRPLILSIFKKKDYFLLVKWALILNDMMDDILRKISESVQIFSQDELGPIVGEYLDNLGAHLLVLDFAIGRLREERDMWVANACIFSTSFNDVEKFKLLLRILCIPMSVETRLAVTVSEQIRSRRIAESDMVARGSRSSTLSDSDSNAAGSEEAENGRTALFLRELAALTDRPFDEMSTKRFKIAVAGLALSVFELPFSHNECLENVRAGHVLDLFLDWMSPSEDRNSVRAVLFELYDRQREWLTRAVATMEGLKGKSQVSSDGPYARISALRGFEIDLGQEEALMSKLMCKMLNKEICGAPIPFYLDGRPADMNIYTYSAHSPSAYRICDPVSDCSDKRARKLAATCFLYMSISVLELELPSMVNSQESLEKHATAIGATKNRICELWEELMPGDIIAHSDYPPSPFCRSIFTLVVECPWALRPAQIKSILATEPGRLMLKSHPYLRHGLRSYADFTARDFMTLNVRLDELTPEAIATIPIGVLSTILAQKHFVLFNDPAVVIYGLQMKRCLVKELNPAGSSAESIQLAELIDDCWAMVDFSTIVIETRGKDIKRRSESLLSVVSKLPRSIVDGSVPPKLSLEKFLATIACWLIQQELLFVQFVQMIQQPLCTDRELLFDCIQAMLEQEVQEKKRLGIIFDAAKEAYVLEEDGLVKWKRMRRLLQQPIGAVRWGIALAQAGKIPFNGCTVNFCILAKVLKDLVPFEKRLKEIFGEDALASSNLTEWRDKHILRVVNNDLKFLEGIIDAQYLDKSALAQVWKSRAWMACAVLSADGVSIYSESYLRYDQIVSGNVVPMWDAWHVLITCTSGNVSLDSVEVAGQPDMRARLIDENNRISPHLVRSIALAIEGGAIVQQKSQCKCIRVPAAAANQHTMKPNQGKRKGKTSK